MFAPTTVAAEFKADDALTFASVEAPPVSEPVQFLDARGQLTELGLAHVADLGAARQFFRDMFLARRLDTEALALQRHGELGLWLMSLGQEAAQVGSIRALRSTDYVFPTYREHAAALVRGVTSADLLRQWRGCSHGAWDPNPHRFHIYSLVLGSQTLHATGYAMGVVRDGVDEVVMCYLGDGAASQGDVSEALNWAATMAVPVVFFCQNNHWAISTPSTSQSRTRLHQRAAGFGLESYLVDGNDVLAVHAVTSQAVEQARSRSIPVFIEAETYRMGGHSTADDPGKYRHDEEVERWRARDPLTRLRVLLEQGGTEPAFFERLEVEAEEFGDEIRRSCLSLPEPKMDDLFKQVYAEAHPLLEQQAAEYATYAASFVE